MITNTEALTRVIEHREIFHDEMLTLMRRIMTGEMSPTVMAYRIAQGDQCEVGQQQQQVGHRRSVPAVPRGSGRRGMPAHRRVGEGAGWGVVQPPAITRKSPT